MSMVALGNRLAASLDPFLDEATATELPAAVVHIGRAGETLYHRAAGWLDPPTRRNPARPETLFDLASLTKLFTTTAFLHQVAAGQVGLDDPVAAVLPAFTGRRPIRPYEDPLQPGRFITISQDGDPVDAGAVTFRHLLTHTSGLPAWRPLFQQPDAIHTTVLNSFFAYPTGAQFLYSDLGFILLGWAVEALAGRSLAGVIQHSLRRLPGASAIQYGPIPAALAAPTELCSWRNRRMQGEVHDENAWAMGGVAGHAGLFGTAAGVAAFGHAWLAARQDDHPLLPHSIALEATTVGVEDGPVRRGLGWALWSPDPDASAYSLGRQTFGHTGFTGTSLYIDPERDLVVACLTNEVYNGRHDRHIAAFRTRLHRRVAEAL